MQTCMLYKRAHEELSKGQEFIYRDDKTALKTQFQTDLIVQTLNRENSRYKPSNTIVVTKLHKCGN